MKAGVAISPDTPSTAISDEVGELADMLLVMTVYPGEFCSHFFSLGHSERDLPRPWRAKVYRALRAQGRRTPRTVSHQRYRGGRRRESQDGRRLCPSRYVLYVCWHPQTELDQLTSS